MDPIDYIFPNLTANILFLESYLKIGVIGDIKTNLYILGHEFIMEKVISFAKIIDLRI